MLGMIQGTQIDCLGQCGGDATRDCNNECNGTHHWGYFCEESDGLGIALDLSTHTLTCFAENENGNCRPNTDSCLYVDCEVDTIFIETVIDCNFELPICDSDIEICAGYRDYKGDGECDFEFTNCEAFEFDGGDCNLIDCSGLHFSEELCEKIYEKFGDVLKTHASIRAIKKVIKVNRLTSIREGIYNFIKCY